jgi:2-polyprenyl-3-methyl-5-hydroxy-6-metoxy-1,4-benzoquinol methylase
MPRPSSGDAEYILGHSPSEYERLIEQGALLGSLTERVLRAAGCTTGMRVLDVGCGVGEVVRVVGEIVGPTGSVVGVDVDEDAVVLARIRLASLGVNFTGLVGDFRAADVGNDYDMVCCRMVLQYQADATAAIRSMGARVRSGGVVVAQEIAPSITGMRAVPAFPLAERVQGWVTSALAASGGNHNVGVELGWRFREAGLVPTDLPMVEMVCATGDTAVAARRYETVLASLMPALQAGGLATEAEIDLRTFQQRWRAEAAVVKATVVLWPALVGWWAHRP